MIYTELPIRYWLGFGTSWRHVIDYYIPDTPAQLASHWKNDRIKYTYSSYDLNCFNKYVSNDSGNVKQSNDVKGSFRVINL